MKLFCKILKKSSLMMVLTIMCSLLLSVTAFAETEETQEVGPGIEMDVQEETVISEGTSLGIFTTTGYCNCEKCSGGHNLTYSGTVPQANHTISADLTVLPIGTKVRINDTVYTVEDIGGGVDGTKVDIFYSSHDDAWAHGRQQEEVFLIESSESIEE